MEALSFALFYIKRYSRSSGCNPAANQPQGVSQFRSELLLGVLNGQFVLLYGGYIFSLDRADEDGQHLHYLLFVGFRLEGNAL